MIYPASDCFIRNCNSALREQIFDVAEAEREPKVQAKSLAERPQAGTGARVADFLALSQLASKGSDAALRQFVNPLDLLNPLRAQKQVIGSKNG